MATIIVAQDILAAPGSGRGGHAMCVLQWLKGLERLGHEVFFFNLFPVGEKYGRDAEPVVQNFGRLIARWWHPSATALVDTNTGRSWYGLDDAGVRGVVARADAAIVLGGPCLSGVPKVLGEVRPRILVDYDPAYTHLWAALKTPEDIYGIHDVYFTTGNNIGTPRCRVPTHGLDWKPIWNPVVLDWWETGRPVTRGLTTVADWWGMGYLHFEGQMLGPKADEFRRFIELPKLAGESLEIAIEIDWGSKDVALLRENGWLLEDPALVAEPQAYRDYISGSAGEFTCAKGVYVGTRSGWFSDRSSCYLAAGRPVVVQATGFEDLLPTGKGLFAVSTPEEAAEAIRAVRRDYALHSAGARSIAEEHFDSDKLLARVLDQVGIGPARKVKAACPAS